jgi:hypothetical protein
MHTALGEFKKFGGTTLQQAEEELAPSSSKQIVWNDGDIA